MIRLRPLRHLFHDSQGRFRRPDGWSAVDLLTQCFFQEETAAEYVRAYYRKHPDRHDAAIVAARVGLSVGRVHDIRAKRQ
jgi:hypothetical protein